MKIFGQPADYSDILQRIFWCTLFTGFVCTLLLAQVSPAFKDFINLISTDASLPFAKGVKILYVIIPGIIAVFSRTLKLHDRISDALGIRFHFDTTYLLYPLCKGTGISLSEERKEKIQKVRRDAMYQTFYAYAGFKSPNIDDQLVRTAADNWGWFWVLIESFLLLLITVVIFACLQKWIYAAIISGFIFVVILLIFHFWNECIKSADPQIKAILRDPKRNGEIRNYFSAL